MNDDLKKIFEQLAQNAPQLREGMAQMAQGFAEKQKNISIVGKSGVDAVTISINGVPEVTSVELNETFSTYSKNEQQILIKTALEDCLTQLKSHLSTALSK